MELAQYRNIGISAHIDSGKTTLSERMLFYAGRIHRMHEVHGAGAGATMDHMELERERGITITSAATSFAWAGCLINLIDTPGHVDFTVEVERSLRVLDGAVLVLCAVGGVQSQSMTVDLQMKRYHVPRVAFINKMDRAGADPLRVCREVREKLGSDPILMQWPMGTGEDFAGVIDLAAMEAVYFENEDGRTVRRAEIPAELADRAAAARSAMLESLAMYSDELMERLLEEAEVSEDLIHRVARDATQQLDATPVLLGAAYRNKGVQPLLDAIVRYLPSPLVREIKARRGDGLEEERTLRPDPEQPFVGMAFKIVDDPFGQLTFFRIYQGRIRKGAFYVNQRTGRKERFSRIVRMHADKREEVDQALAGDIVAVVGVQAASGDTYAEQPGYCSLERMFVPEPVIKVSVSPLQRADSDRLSKALARFRKEDPTFRVTQDPETGEILLAGMGELHLEVYVERMRREYGVQVEVGAPKVSYRESPQRDASFDFRRRKQTGGAGQYAHIIGRFEPLPADAEESFAFEERVTGGRIPRQFFPAIERGFRESLAHGPLAKYPVTGLRVILEDGSYHEVDSSDLAFRMAARDCFQATFPQTQPAILEPVMRLDVECPEHRQGAVTADLSARRAIITSAAAREGRAVLTAEIPLAETFGYATDLRSLTQGQGTFAMELLEYRKTPASVQEAVVAERRKSQLVGAR